MNSVIQVEAPAQTGHYHRRRAVLGASACCGVFFGLTAIYCYVYAVLAPTAYQAEFASVISCVGRDWLLWLLSFPLLAHFALRFDMASGSGRAALIKLMVVHTFALGAVRMLAEYQWGSGTLTEVLLIYLPRYLFVTALLILGGGFYIYKAAAEQRIRDLSHPCPSEPADEAVTSPEKNPPPVLVAYKGTSRVLVPVEAIACVSASGNYVELQTDKGSFLLRSTMKEIAGQLCPTRFVRVHRSHIVNLEAVESVCCGRLEAKLSNGAVIRIGRTYMKGLPHLK